MASDVPARLWLYSPLTTWLRMGFEIGLLWVYPTLGHALETKQCGGRMLNIGCGWLVRSIAAGGPSDHFHLADGLWLVSEVSAVVLVPNQNVALMPDLERTARDASPSTAVIDSQLGQGSAIGTRARTKNVTFQSLRRATY